MKIKDYLNIMERLPKCYHSNNREKVSFLDYENKLDGLKYNVIEFKETSYRDINNNIKCRWVMVSNIKINYKVDEIHISCSDDFIYYTLITLCKEFNFKSDIQFRDDKRRYFYINFKSKFWCFDINNYEDTYYIDDDLILRNIFYESVNEYPNGIPIIWED